MDKYIKLDDKTIIKIGDPNKRHFIIKSNFAKNYMGYLLIMEDLKSVLEALDKLGTEISENITRESLSFYVVIMYAKAFSKADVRKVKLEKNQLKNLPTKLMNLHGTLIDIRNKHVAHAGSELFSVTNLVTQFDDNSSEIFLSGLSLSSFNFNINSIIDLVKEVLKICEIKKEKAFEDLKNNFLSKEEAEKISFFPKNFKAFSFEEIQNVLIKLNQDYYEE